MGAGMTADEIIAALGLERHPEGGWYRQTDRSPLELAPPALPSEDPGARASATTTDQP